MFDAILVGSQIRLEGFVLLLECLQLVELALTEVLRLQHLLLAACPVLVSIGLCKRVSMSWMQFGDAVGIFLDSPYA